MYKNKHMYITYRSFRNFLERKIKSEIAHALFKAIAIEENVNDSISVFYNIK